MRDDDLRQKRKIQINGKGNLNIKFQHLFRANSKNYTWLVFNELGQISVQELRVNHSEI